MILRIKYLIYLLLLPRLATTLPIYLSVLALHIVKNERVKRVLTLYCAFSSFLIFSFLYNSLLRSVSATAFIIEFFLLSPFLLLLSKHKDFIAFDKNLIDKLNVLVFFLSVLNMAINHGFPAKLPYVHFLPDAFSAFWGNGGVKIVTLIGGIGIIVGLDAYIKTGKVSKLIGFSVINFIVPNYVIGMVCVTIGILIFVSTLYISKYRRSKRSMKSTVAIVILGIFATLLTSNYIIKRADDLHPYFEKTFEMHPKLYAYNRVLEMFIEKPDTLIFGSGLGNYSGTAALWASTYISAISDNERPNIPGLHESQLHNEYLAPALKVALVDRWAISSSFNKPYTTLSTLLAETGFFYTILIIVFFLRYVFRTSLIKPTQFAIIGIYSSIFMIDNLHTNPLIISTLILVINATQCNKIENEY